MHTYKTKRKTGSSLEDISSKEKKGQPENDITVIYIYIYIYICVCVCVCVWIETKLPHRSKKWATIVEGNPKAPFSIATTPRCRGGRYSFPGLLYFTLDPYLIMLSVKQGGIKYHFLSLWYDSTWDWTQVSRAIGEHSNR